VRRAILLLAAVLAVALAATAAGCGGGGSKSSGKPLTKSEFVAKADGICTATNKKQPKLPTDLSGVDPTGASVTDKQLDEFGSYIDKIVKLFRSEINDLHGVKPPADLQNDYDKALANLDEAINELSDAAGAAHNADRAKFKSKLAESDKHSATANDLAKKLGLQVCGSNA
jgi:hypothetical protein